MNAAAPWSAIEGFKIVPDRCLIQGRVGHPGHESGRCVSFPLDVTDSAIGGFGDGDAKVETGIASAEGEAGQSAAARGTWSHKLILRQGRARRPEFGSGA